MGTSTNLGTKIKANDNTNARNSSFITALPNGKIIAGAQNMSSGADQLFVNDNNGSGNWYTEPYPFTINHGGGSNYSTDILLSTDNT